MTNHQVPGPYFLLFVICGFAPVAPPNPSNAQGSPVLGSKFATVESEQTVRSTSGAEAVPVQFTRNRTRVESASVNLMMEHGPAEPKASNTSGHTALFPAMVVTMACVVSLAVAGIRLVKSGAVCHESTPGH